jgi:putative membrane protein
VDTGTDAPATHPTAERTLIILMIALLATVVGIHAYHIAWRVPPAQRIPWMVIVPLFTSFGFVHALYTLGWQRSMLFLAVTCATGFFFEFVGVKTGMIFGRYLYTDVLGPKILATVPFIIPPAYFMMLYPSYVITNLILDARPEARDQSFGRLIGATLMTGLVMTAWDLSNDPLMADQVKAWRWLDGGPYFGIPTQNFFGWIAVSITICFVYRLLEQRLPIVPCGRPFPWVMILPIIGYGAFALSDILIGYPDATRVIPPFAMGIPVIAAVVRLFDRPVETPANARERTSQHLYL